MRATEMGFLGKITASMTHEIKNTLAIILESAGLLSDFLSMSQQASFPYKERFQKVLGTINDQVQRGVVLATRLNQFAHSMDEPRAEVKLADHLELVVALMQRLVRRRGLELAAVPPGPEVSFQTDPFRLLLVLCSVVEKLAEGLESGGRIVLKSPPAAPGVAILVEMQGEPKGDWQREVEILLDSLKEIITSLDARPTISPSPSAPGVVLTLAGGAG